MMASTLDATCATQPGSRMPPSVAQELALPAGGRRGAHAQQLGLPGEDEHQLCPARSSGGRSGTPAAAGGSGAGRWHGPQQLDADWAAWLGRPVRPGWQYAPHEGNNGGCHRGGRHLPSRTVVPRVIPSSAASRTAMAAACRASLGLPAPNSLAVLRAQASSPLLAAQLRQQSTQHGECRRLRACPRRRAGLSAACGSCRLGRA